MKEVKHYSDHFKRGVVKEVLLGEESLEYYRRKYKIGGSTTLSKWMNKFACEKEVSMARKKEGEGEELAKLKAELELLRRELEEERLRRQAYELMIKIAEEEFNIPIEKKYGVKQSKK